jgi:hypothetical protein
MPRTVTGSALVVGDVIQDSARTGDTHPYVVVAKSAYQITLRNCTSHETSSLTLVKVVKADKTGDVGWAGEDSYVVKSGNTTDLNVYDVVVEQIVEQQVLPVGPPVLMTFMGEDGKPYYDYVQPTGVFAVPRLVNRYSNATYRVVGGIKLERMTTLLMELAA